jgi:hypothetical protein
MCRVCGRGLHERRQGSALSAVRPDHRGGSDFLGDKRTHALLPESVFAKGAPSVPAYVPWAGRKNHAILGLPHDSCFR